MALIGLIGIALVGIANAADPGTNPNPASARVVEVINIDAGCGTGVTTPPKRPMSLFPGNTEKKFAEARAIELAAKGGCVTAQANATGTVQLARAVDELCRKGSSAYVTVGGNTFACGRAAESYGYGFGGVDAAWAFGSADIAAAYAADSGFAPSPNVGNANPAPTAGSTPPVSAPTVPNGPGVDDALWALTPGS